MMKEYVGEVTIEEQQEILILFERKNGIEELMNSMDSDLLSDETREILINKMMDEMGKVRIQSQNWWNRMHEKYQWKSVVGSSWHIDFDTCKIYLEA